MNIFKKLAELIGIIIDFLIKIFSFKTEILYICYTFILTIILGLFLPIISSFIFGFGFVWFFEFIQYIIKQEKPQYKNVLFMIIGTIFGLIYLLIK